MIGRGRQRSWTLLGQKPRTLAIPKPLSVLMPQPARSGEGINLLFKASD